MRGQRAAEVLAVADGRSDEGTAHGVGVEGEVAQQHADREDEDRRIGRQHAGRRGREVVEVHRRRDEPVEERHQHARHDGQYDAFAVLGRRVAALAHAPRGDAVADDCDNDERNAQEKHDGIAFRRSDVVDDDAQHQRESHAQREGHRKPGQRYRGREQDVRGVEDHAAQHDAADASPFGRREVFEEGTALLEAVDGRIPNFAGIKYTYESIYEYNQCRLYKNGKYDMLHGQDETILPSLAMGGAQGGIGGTTNYNGINLVGIIDAWKAGDIEKARELQNFSQEVINVICHYRGNIVGGKRIMKLIGLDLGKNRTPFQNMTDEEEQRMKAELEAIHFFDRCNKF